MRSLFLILFLFTLAACTAPDRREQEFNSIQMGMVKSEVLQLAGPPHWSDRWQGHDRWIYYMKPEDRQTERVVYFRQGKVVLTGERIQPVLSAQEMDELKKPRLKKSSKEFQPSLSEDELREAIKKEIKKQNKNDKPPKFETI